MTRRLILILGNFKAPRKAVLNAVRAALRGFGLLPVIFDFDGPSAKDTTGTVETLARLAGVVVADLTDPSSVPHELATIVPFLRTTPVVLLRQKGATGYSMAANLKSYSWVQGEYWYDAPGDLVRQLRDIVAQATRLANTLHDTDPMER